MAPTVNSEKNRSDYNNKGLHDMQNFHRNARNRRTTRSSPITASVSTCSLTTTATTPATINCVASFAVTHSDTSIADKLQQKFSQLTTRPYRDGIKRNEEQDETKDSLPTANQNKDNSPAMSVPNQYFTCDHAKASSSSPSTSSTSSATDADDHMQSDGVVPATHRQVSGSRTSQRSRIHKKQTKTKSYTDIGDMRRTALLVVAIKTIHLVKRNQLLQQRLESLQRETSAFINEVMANPENKRSICS